jgi:exonuclease 1
MNRVRMLLHFGVTPYLVFDGDYLPSKAGTEQGRAQKRKDAKTLGLELLALKKHAQAHLELQKAVDVTPEMARLFIEELKKSNIQYVVAPFEADSQLAYLEREGIIQGILSEDSDLLVFGAKVLLTKLDQYGDCIMIRRQDFTACREVSLVGWSDVEFRRMAILSGCDYLPNISKMGLKTAHRLVRKHKTIERIIRALQFDGQFKVPNDYLQSFNQAELTFLHQWVFDPQAKKTTNLHPISGTSSWESMPFIGEPLEDEIAAAVARGDLNPHTKLPIVLNRPHTGPIRPIGQRSRRVVQSSSENEKKSQSLDEFFKPKRIPLSEMDANTFTPSPSQQRLLDQERRPWTPSYVPPVESPLDRASIQPAGRSPITSTQRRSLSESLQRANSSPHPIKRQRLCSDNAIDTPTDGSVKVESGRSRFFATSGIAPSSPSGMRKTRKQKQSKDDFQLWSDDSIQDAMAQLSETQHPNRATRKAGKINVFSDADQPLFLGHTAKSATSKAQNTTHTSHAQEEVDESQLTIVSTTFTEPDEGRGSRACTPATSIGSPISHVDDSQLSIFTESINSQTSALEQRFSYQSGISAVATVTAKPSNKSRDWAKDLKFDLSKSSVKSSSKVTPSIPSNTRNAPSEVKLASTNHHVSEDASVVDKDTQRRPEYDIPAASVANDHGDEFHTIDETCQTLEPRLVSENVIIPTTPSAPKYIPQVAKKHLSPKGSEDFMVPCSDEELEHSSPTNQTGSPFVPKILDLGKFMFKR